MANRKNEVIAAPQGEPPSSFGSMPSSARQRIERRRALLHQIGRQFLRRSLVEALRLVNELQLFLLLLWSLLTTLTQVPFVDLLAASDPG